MISPVTSMVKTERDNSQQFKEASVDLWMVLPCHFHRDTVLARVPFVFLTQGVPGGGFILRAATPGSLIVGL